MTADPTAGWARPKVPVDTTRALTRAQVTAIWKLDVPLRDKALWRMLYETAARAEEVLGLDFPDLDMPSERDRVISKGGSTDWVHWQTGAALLLPPLLAGRREGPVFLTLRRPARPVAGGTCAPSPAGPGCPTAVPRSPSSSRPGPSPILARRRRSSRWRTAGPCTCGVPEVCLACELQR